jgi:hypothetical protein
LDRALEAWDSENKDFSDRVLQARLYDQEAAHALNWKAGSAASLLVVAGAASAKSVVQVDSCNADGARGWTMISTQEFGSSL